LDDGVELKVDTVGLIDERTSDDDVDVKVDNVRLVDGLLMTEPCDDVSGLLLAFVVVDVVAMVVVVVVVVVVLGLLRPV